MKKLYLSLFTFLVLLPQCIMTSDRKKIKPAGEARADIEQQKREIKEECLNRYNFIISLSTDELFNEAVNKIIRMKNRASDRISNNGIGENKGLLTIFEERCEVEAIALVIDTVSFEDLQKPGFQERIQRLQDVINATNELITTIAENMN